MRIISGIILILGLAACSTAASTSTVHHPASAAPNPAAACQQLAGFHNNGAGISRTFRSELLSETKGATGIYPDMHSWLTDLAVTPAQISTWTPSQSVAYIEKTSADAQAVGSDCQNYGISNVLPGA